jgi:hypothetical protein
VRPLRLVACVMPSLPSARLSPEGSHMLSYLCICIARCRTCVHSRYVRYVYQPSGAGSFDSPLVSCPSRSSRYLCVVMFWSYLAIAGNAPSGQSHLCHPFTCGSPASPLLSRTPITKYISSCKVNSSTSTLGIISAPSKAVKCSKGSNLNLCH